MAGSWRIVLGVVLVSFGVASTAGAFNGRFRSPPRVSYYYVVPMVYWCPVGPTVIPVPDARPGVRYAPATAAPPSGTNEPPLKNMLDKKSSSDVRMPVIVTSHSTGKAAPAKDRCRVGFWNLSGRDVTLTIDGKAMKLAKDRAVTLDLDRQFSWQVDGRPLHLERLAEGQATHEVVIPE